MKKNKQTAQEVFNNLPSIPKEEYKFLWIDEYYDGPVAGMLIHKNEMLYFMMYADREFNAQIHKFTKRTFTVHRLKPKALKLQIYWHDLFTELVGDHYDYNEENKITMDFSAKNKPEWESFYERRKKEYEPNEPDLDDPNTGELIAVIKN